MKRTILTLVTARRPGGPGFSHQEHLTVDGNLRQTACGLEVRSPINHLAPAFTLATCKHCRRIAGRLGFNAERPG